MNERKRKPELSSIFKEALSGSLSAFLWVAQPVFVAVATFSAYVLAGNELTATKAFTSLALFEVIQFPLTFAPRLVQLMLEVSVSVNRLRKFFLAEEQAELVLAEPPSQEQLRVAGDAGKYVRVVVEGYSDPSAPPITISGGASFQWAEVKDDDAAAAAAEKKKGRLCCSDWWYTGGPGCCGAGPETKETQPLLAPDGELASVAAMASRPASQSPQRGPTLSGIELTIKPGELVCIVGRVGSGKSSLLSAILNDIESVGDGGATLVRGALSYCAQQPWIQNTDVRSNILFGRPFEHERYERVVRWCELVSDFAELTNGDATEIGERGITLSGGQVKHT